MGKNPNKTRPLWLYILLAMITFAVYSQVIWHDFINLDDNKYVTDNPIVNKGLTIEGVKWAFNIGYESNWHPLTWLSHMLDCQIFGLNPAGHHLVNVFIHIINTLLLFAILNAMTGSIWCSAFAAAAFALHPLHVESVAWIAERKDVLSTFFAMLTIAAYLRYTKKPSIQRYLPAILLFALGLMSKPMLITLPFVLLLLDYWPLNRIEGVNSKTLIPLIIEKIPFFVLSALSSIITFIAQQKGGAVLDITLHPFRLRLVNAIVAYAKYIIKIVYPTQLAVIYPFDDFKTLVYQAIPAALLLIAISIIVIRLSKTHRYLFVGWFWYLGTLVPVIGLVQVGIQSMADRYTYIPSIGLFIIAAWGLPELFAKWRYRQRALWAISAIVLLSWSVNSLYQLTFWQNSIELLEHTTNVTKNNALVYGNLAAAYNDIGQPQKAIEVCNKALSLKPDDTKALTNLGIAFGQLKKYDDAIKTLKKGIEINPNDAELHYNLAYTYTQAGQSSLAMQHYQKAIEVNPTFAAAYCNLGVLYGELNQYDKAIESFKKAVEIKPDYADAYYNLGFAYSLIGDKKSAIEQYKILQKLGSKKAQQLYDIINK